MGVGQRIGGTVLFGGAFGWVEAAVVVYLRRIYYPEGFRFPLQPIETSILVVELVREAATLLMLLAVAWLAGRRFWERFAFFVIAFGVWDLAYYLGLKITLGWPASLADWDILFLLPLPWVAPVYAPVSVALMMVAVGVVVARREASGWVCRADRTTWLLGAAGTLVLLYSFMRDTAAGFGTALPKPYPLGLLVLGDALLLGSSLRFLSLCRRPVRDETEEGGDHAG